MEKKFDKWNKLKKEIDIKSNLWFTPRVWEMWYINIWINIWNESLWKWEEFKRAMLVIKKLWNMFFCFSMTTQWKDNNIFYIKLSNNYFNKNSYIIKSQLKSIDRKRFIKRIWILWNKDFYGIKKELKNFIF
jgi:hypothetical protein